MLPSELIVIGIGLLLQAIPSFISWLGGKLNMSLVEINQYIWSGSVIIAVILFLIAYRKIRRRKAIQKARRQQRERVQLYKAEKRDIALAYNEFHSGCKETIHTEGDKYTVYRVGVVALEKTVEQVEVSLAELDDLSLRNYGYDRTIIAGVLSPMRSNQLSPSTFTVNQGESPVHFVDVIKWWHNKAEVQICYHANLFENNKHLPDILKSPGSYSLILSARGKDIPETLWSISILVIKRKIDFKFWGQLEEPIEAGGG
jgi:heme exporter protein D